MQCDYHVPNGPGFYCLSQFFDKLVRAYAAEVVFESKIATMVPDTNALKDLLQRVALSCYWCHQMR